MNHITQRLEALRQQARRDYWTGLVAIGGAMVVGYTPIAIFLLYLWQHAGCG